MSVSDWINFAALANIIVFLWVFRQMLTQEEHVTALRDALRLRPGHLLMKLWWCSFLLCLSYRLGAGSEATVQALAYGIFPTLLAALLLIDLAEMKVKSYTEKLQGEFKRARRRSRQAVKTAEKDSD